MRIDVLTLFPEMFGCYLGESILKRARDAGLLAVHLHNIRDYAAGKHRVTDEPPYGGGSGMVLKPEPIFTAVETLLHQEAVKPPIILLTPQGRLFSQRVAEELAQQERLLFLCGRYEGIDERVRQHLVTDEISIGDYVLTGGELAAMVVIDAVARLLPGVLGAADAAAADSHSTGLLEGPHYTRPADFRGWPVPAVLRSGHTAHIERWRRQQALRRTWQRRPELLLTAVLTAEDKQFLAELAGEAGC
jgi:tRNA (guanine37-N1)-methyltransferase